MFSQIFINKFLFKILLVAFFGLMFTIFVPISALAQGDIDSNINRYTDAFAGEEGADFARPLDPRTVVGNVIKIFLGFLGILFLVYAIYAGYLIMSSGGEEDKIRKGKSTLQTASIGVFVIFSVYSLLYFVLGSVLFGIRARPAVYIEGRVDTKPYNFCQDGVIDRFGDCQRR